MSAAAATEMIAFDQLAAVPAGTAAHPVKQWGGRFAVATDPLVERFTASVAVDGRLLLHDIMGSIAHARMLGRQGIVSPEEAAAIEAGLIAVREAAEAGTLAMDGGLEDVHTVVEVALRAEIGELAGKLHTARSRNDQVALDLRLFTREACAQAVGAIAALQEAFLEQARSCFGLIMPGYTHLQRAQPILVSHHLLAYVEMLQRDVQRFAGCFGRADVLPLGSGALAGVPYPVDRQWLADELGMGGVAQNSIDAVADRDFAIEFCAAAATCMMHLSRFAEETILWCSAEFGFWELDDSFATGSSIMPQKKNPDVAELIRGKTGRVYGSLTALLTLMKGLPLAYNRDMQEDKPPLFEAVDTLLGCLEACAGMVGALRPNAEAMAAAAGNLLCATDVADYLVGPRAAVPRGARRHRAARPALSGHRHRAAGAGSGDLPPRLRAVRRDGLRPDQPPGIGGRPRRTRRHRAQGGAGPARPRRRAGGPEPHPGRRSARHGRRPGVLRGPDPAGLKIAHICAGRGEAGRLRAEAAGAAPRTRGVRRMAGSVPVARADAAWAVQESGDAALGDQRRTDCLVRLATAVGDCPRGLLVHTTLAVTPERVSLGVLAQETWTRPVVPPEQRVHRRKRPLTEKESQRWCTAWRRSMPPGGPARPPPSSAWATAKLPGALQRRGLAHPLRHHAGAHAAPPARHRPAGGERMAGPLLSYPPHHHPAAPRPDRGRGRPLDRHPRRLPGAHGRWPTRRDRPLARLPVPRPAHRHVPGLPPPTTEDVGND